MSFDFIAIDFEIANSSYGSACSLGLVGVKDNAVVEEKYYLIKPPGMNFGAKEMEIHKITPETVSNSPLFSELWKEISHYFDGNSIIIAHNAVFDMSVLKNCLMEYNFKIPEFNYICSIPISTRACRGENVGRSLKDRCNYFEIEIGQHHNSLDDARACANLVIKCLKLKKRKSITSYCSTFSSIPIKVFKDLNPLREFRKNKTYNNSNVPRNKFNQISISEITATVEDIDISNDFYNKNLVFTGELKNMDRKQAMQSVVNLGGI
jgi:DNA polymerase-3 subunit epsilon